MAKVVLTYGTFDLFHIGHLRMLERAAMLGDRLVVAVSTDEFNLLKNKRSIVPFEHRRAIVEAIRCVDLVIPENHWEQKVQDILDHKVDIFTMGDDWQGKFDELAAHCSVVYLPRTPNVSTTEISADLGDDEKAALRAISQKFSL